MRLSKSIFGLTAGLLFLLASLSLAHADAALLLEEPYGHLGFFTATGHSAVYLTRVCADSPSKLRRCAEGEAGVVISRYNKVGGYDWIAIPLVPYLYAVDDPDDTPLFVNPKMVAFLRNEYRKHHLESIAPDESDGEPPVGNWTQLVGAAYDRTLYGFEIQTTPEQDDDFIQAYNAGANRSHFNLITHNCADFAASVINFYYPHTLHRSLISDIGITTPKQISKLLVKYSSRHPELASFNFVIPQVPGMPRSTPVHGVVESVLKSKKYLLPLALLHPVVTGGLAVAYVDDGRFDPTHHAMVFDSGKLESPLVSSERREYQSELKKFLARDPNALRNEKHWLHLESKAEPRLDNEGRPTLEVHMGEEVVDVGVSRENILSSYSSSLLAQEMLTTRLHMELERGVGLKVSETEVNSDWKLLQSIPGPAGLE